MSAWQLLRIALRALAINKPRSAHTMLGIVIGMAAVVVMIGRLVGVALGLGAAAAIASLAGWRVALSAGAVALAVAFALAIGVFFGFYPARKAAQLNPVDALRFE